MKAKVAVLGQRERERELCESRGGRPGPERESCVKFEVAVLGQREREREREVAVPNSPRGPSGRKAEGKQRQTFPGCIARGGV